MPEYLSPGVYVEEISTGPRPIEGVGTSTAGIVGQTERGPEEPRLISSWLEFQRWYGGFIPDVSYVAYAIQGFFENGGQRCYVTRVASSEAVASQAVIGNLQFVAYGRGAWGNNLRIKVSPPSNNAPNQFRVSILYYTNFPDPFVDPTDPANAANPDLRPPDTLEVFDNLSAEPRASNNVMVVINSRSRLVRCDWTDDGPAGLPVTGFDAGEFSQGDDGAAVVAADFTGSKELIPVPAGLPTDILGRGRGLDGLATVDDIALLLVPDQARDDLFTPINNAIITQCELLKDRFGVLSVRQGQSNVNNIDMPRDTLYAALYHPWIWIFDPTINDYRLVPPAGHIAGIMARTDIERGVHKAPANEVVRGAVEIEFPITKSDQDMLNPRGVNCIRDFRPDGRGIRLWGARTLSSDALWKYVNVRRLFIFVEESIDEGSQWVVFEPNDDLTWGYVRRSISNFLTRLWKNGALFGTTEEEAFFVRCDRTTMTQDDIDNGRLICYIGIAPVKPAEFVIFRIQQYTATENQQ